MFRLIKTRTRNLTHSLAQEFMSMKPFPGDRPLSKIRLKYLEDEIQAGRFHGCEWVAFECAETGETYRMNGKHTCHIFSDPNIPVEGMRVVVKFFYGKTLQDGAECYQTFDDAACSRTASDVNRSVAGCIEALSVISNRLISFCVQGMSMAKFGVDYGASHSGGAGKKVRAALLYDNEDFCLFIKRLATGGNFRPLQRGPVAGAMFKSFGESPELAEQFWLAVRDGTSHDPNAPDRNLQRYLLTKNLNIGGGVRGGVTKHRHVTRREMNEYCLLAWAKWCKIKKKKTTES